MRIAVVGCCHGDLQEIYGALAEADKFSGKKTDLLLICGDFQAVRNAGDMQCLAVPDKYRKLGIFHEYYSGKKVAPYLTITIGGNHEASNYLWELYHGGWVAPSIYYLGCAGSLLLNGLRISGASGIYNHRDYRMGHFERMPLDRSTLRSIYHIREFDVFRLGQLRHSSPDIVLSHDWPTGIWSYGNEAQLFKYKPHLRADAKKGILACQPFAHVLDLLRPRYWFAAHHHTLFPALVKHDGTPTVVGRTRNEDEIAIDVEDDQDGDSVPKSSTNADEIEIDVDDDGDEASSDKMGVEPDSVKCDAAPIAGSGPPSTKANVTKFLALNKCLPGREFMQIIEVEAPIKGEGVRMTYDPLWLAIVRAFDPFMPLDRAPAQLPVDENIVHGRVSKELAWVRANLANRGEVPVEDIQKFERTAPSTEEQGGRATAMPRAYANPQTAAFCRLVGIEDRISPVTPDASET